MNGVLESAIIGMIKHCYWINMMGSLTFLWHQHLRTHGSSFFPSLTNLFFMKRRKNFHVYTDVNATEKKQNRRISRHYVGGSYMCS